MIKESTRETYSAFRESGYPDVLSMKQLEALLGSHRETILADRKWSEICKRCGKNYVISLMEVSRLLTVKG